MQVPEVVDHPVRAKLCHRYIGVAEGDGDDRNARILRRVDVGPRIAHHDGPAWIPARAGNGFGQMPRIRLVERERVLSADEPEAPTHAQVWNDRVQAYDMGTLAAQWFADFLQPGQHAPGQGLRLVRFNPEHQRLCDPRWTGSLPAQTAFADGYPLLVANTASLHDLNQRLAAAGAAPVDMRRFRPNLVLDGLPAFDEDHTQELWIDTADGEVELRLVKPCTRCSMPNIDPSTALSAPAVGDALAAYRADPRVGGAVTFGMNAVVVRGIEFLLQAGQTVRGRIAFG